MEKHLEDSKRVDEAKGIAMIAVILACGSFFVFYLVRTIFDFYKII